jgi:hypothetical protein
LQSFCDDLIRTDPQVKWIEFSEATSSVELERRLVVELEAWVLVFLAQQAIPDRDQLLCVAANARYVP